MASEISFETSNLNLYLFLYRWVSHRKPRQLACTLLRENSLSLVILFFWKALSRYVFIHAVSYDGKGKAQSNSGANVTCYLVMRNTTKDTQRI